MLLTLQWTDSDPDARAIRIADVIPGDCIEPAVRDKLCALRAP